MTSHTADQRSERPGGSCGTTGTECDGCHTSIVGTRWKCVNCFSYDLCEKCEVDNPDKEHPSTHLFMKITKPVSGYGYHRVLPDLYTEVKPVEKQPAPLIGPCCTGSCVVTSENPSECDRCGVQTESSSFQFCPTCSCELEVCYFCSKPIRDGDYYMEFVERRLQRLEENLKSDDIIAQAMRKIHQMEKDQLEKTKKEIAGKTRLEILIMKSSVSKVF